MPVTLRILTTLALVWVGPIGRADDGRAPVPDAAARATATAELKKEFAKELGGKDVKAKRALAQTLLDRAKASEDEPVKHYVALEQASALAVEVKDVRLALEAVDRLSAAFAANRATLGFAAVDAISHGTKDSGVIAEAAGACLELTGVAFDHDDAATAARSSTAAITLAKSIKLGGIAARATAIAELVGPFRTLSSAAAAAGKTLATTPDDRAAHEAVGRFQCFGRGRFDEGLEHLSKSPNAALADAAARELKRSESPADRDAVADGWWDLAPKEKDALTRARMLGHAATLYEATPADAAAERKAFVKARLDAITFRAFDGGVALTKDFSKDGPASQALATVRSYIVKQGIDRKSNDWKTKLPKFPDLTFSKGEEYVWRLETNQGAIAIRFFCDTAPKHVANFIYLSELGFFDGLNFHRVVPGFMAQGGDPTGSGAGHPGYMFDGEYVGAHKQDKPGMLCMANTGQPTSDGSQFFITFRATTELDGKHTCFGEVFDGMDTLKKLESQGTPDPGKPKIPLVIVSARVTVK